jgi:hypothetical protein
MIATSGNKVVMAFPQPQREAVFRADRNVSWRKCLCLKELRSLSTVRIQVP